MLGHVSLFVLCASSVAGTGSGRSEESALSSDTGNPGVPFRIELDIQYILPMQIDKLSSPPSISGQEDVFFRCTEHASHSLKELRDDKRQSATKDLDLDF
jgi:hypothetical protein